MHKAFPALPTHAASMSHSPVLADAPHAGVWRIVDDSPRFDAEAGRLYARAFGPGRHAKAASMLREGNTCLHALSRVALDAGGALIAACRLWPVRAGEGRALFLGPIAVDPDARAQGLGQALAEATLDAARGAGHGVVVLVGDLGWFERLGFEPVPQGLLELPAPVDPARLLWIRLHADGDAWLAGRVKAAP